MASSISTPSRSMKTRGFAIVGGIMFLALVASKITVAMNRSETEKLPPQASRRDRTTDVSVTHKLNNAGYFTSMTAEFEWDRFMVPGFDFETIDPNLSIERKREIGRRLLRGLHDGE